MRYLVSILCLLGLSLLFLGGCDEDTLAPTTRGVVIIDGSPDSINFSWTLSLAGAQAAAGAGDTTLIAMPAGAYSITWGVVSGWGPPHSAVLELVDTDTILFEGAYLAEPGTILIDVAPDSLDIAWTLGGPEDYSRSGVGDQTIGELAAGSYTLSCLEIAGWFAPAPITRNLAPGVSLTIAAVFYEDLPPAEGFVLLPAGEFMMGSPIEETGRDDDETLHAVQLGTPFHIQTTEVTNLQYAELADWAWRRGFCTVTGDELHDDLDDSSELLLDMRPLGDTAISFNAEAFYPFIVSTGLEDHPVKSLSWYGAAAYCDWLSLREGRPRAYHHGFWNWSCNDNDPYGAQGYRLPTEAEWEYACRAGTTTAFANGSITDTGCADPGLDLIGWYCGNAGGLTHPVASKIPNAWGLYDMHGNVSEWCDDRFAAYGGTITDPVGPESGYLRVVRGGWWPSHAADCRSAFRGVDSANFTMLSRGFRPVRSARNLE